MPLMTSLKQRLVKRGPKSRLLLQAFRLQAALHGISMPTADGKIRLKQGQQEILLAGPDAISVPFVVHQWQLFKETLTPDRRNGIDVLDLSHPGLRHYRKIG